MRNLFCQTEEKRTFQKEEKCVFLLLIEIW